ncbi:NAD-dependent protein deacylase [Proteinivorax hydrogeniformans]|uniref:NAD-dependent protein deacetylase n=1 Tax=Proteinivorax hydrogeniformans TaxID=1826727 RepID=A0AAU8HQS4_9FIRM
MKLQKLKKLIKESNNIVFFGGAGVSTESGIPDFRSAQGIHNSDSGLNYSPEEILSYSFFTKHPDIFYKFYKEKIIHKEAKPNAAHKALAKLEQQGKVKAVITQNVDGLHQKAKSKNVLELHGSIYRNYCLECNKSYDLDYILKSNTTPKCQKCQGIIKPDVTLYEESLNMDTLQKAITHISKADLLIVGGTSLTVYPAAHLIDYYRGNKLVVINKQPTHQDWKAYLSIKGRIGDAFTDCL